MVYPVQDENQWVDGEDRILPDAFVVPNKIQAKNLAYKVHSDLAMASSEVQTGVAEEQ